MVWMDCIEIGLCTYLESVSGIFLSPPFVTKMWAVRTWRRRALVVEQGHALVTTFSVLNRDIGEPFVLEAGNAF